MLRPSRVRQETDAARLAGLPLTGHPCRPWSGPWWWLLRASLGSSQHQALRKFRFRLQGWMHHGARHLATLMRDRPDWPIRRTFGCYWPTHMRPSRPAHRSPLQHSHVGPTREAHTRCRLPIPPPYSACNTAIAFVSPPAHHPTMDGGVWPPQCTTSPTGRIDASSPAIGPPVCGRLEPDACPSLPSQLLPDTFNAPTPSSMRSRRLTCDPHC